MFNKTSAIENIVVDLITDPSNEYALGLAKDLASELLEEDKVSDLTSLVERCPDVTETLDGEQVQRKFLEYISQDKFLYWKTPSGNRFDAFTTLMSIVPKIKPKIDAKTISDKIDYYLDELVCTGMGGDLREEAGHNLIERTLDKIEVLNNLPRANYNWSDSASKVQKVHLAILSHLHSFECGEVDYHESISKLEGISSIKPEWQKEKDGVQKIHNYHCERAFNVPHATDTWLSYILKVWETTKVKPGWRPRILQRVSLLYRRCKEAYKGGLVSTNPAPTDNEISKGWQKIYKIFGVKPDHTKEELQGFYRELLEQGHYKSIATVKGITGTAPKWRPEVVHEAYWDHIQPRKDHGPGSEIPDERGIEQVARTTGMRFDGKSITRTFFYHEGIASTIELTLGDHQRETVAGIMGRVFDKS